MADKQSPEQARLTRRNFLHVAAVGSGGALGVSLFGSPAEASSKVSQKSVSYQRTPKGKARCDNCALWQAPSSCKVVAGPISASGWCKIYAAKG